MGCNSPNLLPQINSSFPKLLYIGYLDTVMRKTSNSTHTSSFHTNVFCLVEFQTRPGIEDDLPVGHFHHHSASALLDPYEAPLLKTMLNARTVYRGLLNKLMKQSLSEFCLVRTARSSGRSYFFLFNCIENISYIIQNTYKVSHLIHLL